MTLSLTWIIETNILLSSFPYTMDIFYTYCNPPWNLIFINFLHLIICWVLWFKVLCLIHICLSEFPLANKYAPGKSQSHTLWSECLHKGSTCFPNCLHLCHLLSSWKNVSSSVEPSLFGLSVFWDNVPCLLHSFILSHTCLSCLYIEFILF